MQLHSCSLQGLANELLLAPAQSCPRPSAWIHIFDIVRDHSVSLVHRQFDSLGGFICISVLADLLIIFYAREGAGSVKPGWTPATCHHIIFGYVRQQFATTATRSFMRISGVRFRDSWKGTGDTKHDSKDNEFYAYIILHHTSINVDHLRP